MVKPYIILETKEHGQYIIRDFLFTNYGTKLLKKN